MNDVKPSRKHWRIALGMGCVLVGGLIAFSAYEKRTAIRAIERAGASVWRDHSGPRWLRRWGIEFGPVVLIHGEGEQLNNDTLKNISVLTNVVDVQLYGTRISNGGYKHLGSLKNMKVLSITSHENFSSNELRHFTGLKKLRELTLWSRTIDDDGLGYLSSLPSLEELTLGGDHISDDGLKHLGRMVNLRVLKISSAQITNDGLRHLGKMPSLRWLSIEDSQVTKEGVNALQELLPNCSIFLQLYPGRQELIEDLYRRQQFMPE